MGRDAVGGDRPDGVRPFGANSELADAVAVFQPFTQYARGGLPDVPLWNPHVMARAAVPGQRPVGGLLALHVAGLLLPFWWSLAVMAALKLFVAAFGTSCSRARSGMRVPGALLAGLAFAFGLFFVTWLAGR